MLTPMDNARFHELVASLERLAIEDPEGLRRRARGLVALGYAYVFGLISLLLIALAFLVWATINTNSRALTIKLIFVLGALVLLLLRALWVRVRPPEGVPLDLSRAPRLAARVEAIRAALKAPKADQVLVTMDFNASVTQLPRFGIFGGDRTYLILGLPLMYAVGQRHFDAILAHEYGHLSGAHPKIGLWLGRIGTTWGRLQERTDSDDAGWGGFMVSGFLNWYMPRLNAHAYALRRGDEFAADADSARATSARVAAQALVSLEMRGPHHDEYWSALFKRREHEATAPTDAWSSLPGWLASADSRAERFEWVTRALQRRSLVDDSHPSLRERLASLRVTVPDGSAEDVVRELVPPIGTSAAAHYLSEVAIAQLKTWDREWHAEASKTWGEAHRELRKLRERVGELAGRASTGERLEAAELWELADGVYDLDGAETARPWLEQVVATDPKHAPAHYLLGRYLLSRRDPAGVPLVRRAMALDPGALNAGHELLRAFHAEVADREADVAVGDETERLAAAHRKTIDERHRLLKSDTLGPVTLSADARAALLEAAALKGVGKLWVARKLGTDAKKPPVVVVYVQPGSVLLTSYGTKRARIAAETIDCLGSRGGVEWLVLQYDDHLAWVAQKVQQGGGAVVTAKKRIVVLQPKTWHQRHRRPLVLAGVGGALVAGAFWLFYVPTRYYDDTGITPSGDIARWNQILEGHYRTSGVDIRIMVDSLPAGTDLAQVALQEARERGMGRTNDRRGLFLLLDAATGGMRIEVGPQLEGLFPDGYVGRLLRSHTASLLNSDQLHRVLNSTFMILNHRLMEEGLNLTYDPLAVSDIKDSTRLAAGAGATFSFAAGEPLRLDAVVDTALASAIAAGSTGEEAMQRYLQWLSLPVYVPTARLFTPGSRSYWKREMKMTPGYWEFLRYLYIGAPYRVLERGDYAIVLFTENPLLNPMYLTRSAAGWEVDVLAEITNTRQVAGWVHSWMLTNDDSPHHREFADLIITVDDVMRFKGGANWQIRYRGE
jgi:Zn-dependent protease with chaperone function